MNKNYIGKINNMKRDYNKQNNQTIETKKLTAFIKELTIDQKFKFWIKALLSSYSTIPEIIKTLDKMIEFQATSISFISDIYNKEGSTLNQVEKIIDLSERKNKLLNIYIMTKKLISQLSVEDFSFIEKKFIFNWTCEELSNEFGISIRTVYRKTDKVLNDIFDQAKMNNWSLKFIEQQVDGEDWLKDKYFKQINDYLKLTINHHSQSSSES